ncbi:MAG: recombinase family protein [Pseudomonadota bacterium]
MAISKDEIGPSSYVYVCAEELNLEDLEKELLSKRIRYQRIFIDELPISSKREDREAFVHLMRSLTSGDKLYVPSLGSLGPILRDVLHSIWHFKNSGVSLYCMQMTPVDLTSSAAREIISTLSCALEICCDE